MRSILLMALLLAVTLAGCSDEANEPDEAAPAMDDDPAEPSDPVEAGNVTENAAPTLTFTSDVDAGQVPLTVAFSIDGQDDDGDNMTWTLALGDEVQEGAMVPATVNLTFEEEGVFNVTATLTDGIEFVNATLVITATLGEPAYAGPAPLVITGDTTIPSATFQIGEGCWLEYVVLPTGAGYNMGGDHSGWIYTVDPSSDYAAVFYDSENIGSTGSGTGGVVPAGSFYVDICGAGPGAAMGSYTFTAWHPDHPDAPN